jgi:hypothetical protein
MINHRGYAHLDLEHLIYYKERKGSNFHLDKILPTRIKRLKKKKEIVTKDRIYILPCIKHYPASDRNLEISLVETNTTCNDTMPLTNLTLPISPFHVMATNPILMTS